MFKLSNGVRRILGQLEFQRAKFIGMEAITCPIEHRTAGKKVTGIIECANRETLGRSAFRKGLDPRQLGTLGFMLPLLSGKPPGWAISACANSEGEFGG